MYLLSNPCNLHAHCPVSERKCKPLLWNCNFAIYEQNNRHWLIKITSNHRMKSQMIRDWNSMVSRGERAMSSGSSMHGGKSLVQKSFWRRKRQNTSTEGRGGKVCNIVCKGAQYYSKVTWHIFPFISWPWRNSKKQLAKTQAALCIDM